MYLLTLNIFLADIHARRPGGQKSDLGDRKPGSRCCLRCFKVTPFLGAPTNYLAGFDSQSTGYMYGEKMTIAKFPKYELVRKCKKITKSRFWLMTNEDE